MSGAGLLCRVLTCRQAFPVADGDSMTALFAARDTRNAHEIETHSYRHVERAEPERPPFAPPPIRPKRELEPSRGQLP